MLFRKLEILAILVILAILDKAGWAEVDHGCYPRRVLVQDIGIKHLIYQPVNLPVIFANFSIAQSMIMEVSHPLPTPRCSLVNSEWLHWMLCSASRQRHRASRCKPLSSSQLLKGDQSHHIGLYYSLAVGSLIPHFLRCSSATHFLHRVDTRLRSRATHPPTRTFLVASPYPTRRMKLPMASHICSKWFSNERKDNASISTPHHWTAHPWATRCR